MPRDVIKEIADKVISSMRIDKCTFDIAFTAVMQNYQHLDWAATKSSVGRELGKRKKRRKQKAPAQQLELFLGTPRDQMLRDATEHATSLTAGLPEHDL